MWSLFVIILFACPTNEVPSALAVAMFPVNAKITLPNINNANTNIKQNLTSVFLLVSIRIS